SAVTSNANVVKDRCRSCLRFCRRMANRKGLPLKTRTTLASPPPSLDHDDERTAQQKPGQHVQGTVPDQGGDKADNAGCADRQRPTEDAPRVQPPGLSRP